MSLDSKKISFNKDRKGSQIREISWKVTEEIIKKFLDKCDGLTAEDKTLRLNNCKPLFDSTDYHFSCRIFKETFGQGYCDFNNCVMCEKYICCILAASSCRHGRRYGYRRMTGRRAGRKDLN